MRGRGEIIHEVFGEDNPEDLELHIQELADNGDILKIIAKFRKAMNIYASETLANYIEQNSK